MMNFTFIYFTFGKLNGRISISSLLCLLFVSLISGIMPLEFQSPDYSVFSIHVFVFLKLFASLFLTSPEIIYEQLL